MSTIEIVHCVQITPTSAMTALKPLKVKQCLILIVVICTTRVVNRVVRGIVIAAGSCASVTLLLCILKQREYVIHAI